MVRKSQKAGDPDAYGVAETAASSNEPSAFTGNAPDATNPPEKDDAESYFKRGGEESVIDKQWDAAIADFTRAIELEAKPGVVSLCYRFRADAKRNKGDLAGAIADYTKSVELDTDSDNADSYYGRGLAKKKSGDSDGAIADYAKTIELDPDDANHYLNLSNDDDKIKDLGDSQDAIADLTKIIALDPKNGDAYGLRASAIALSPVWASSCYYGRGYAKKQKGDLEGAAADYAEAREIASNESVPSTNAGTPSPASTGAPAADSPSANQAPLTTISGEPIHEGLNIVGVDAKVVEPGDTYDYVGWKVVLYNNSDTPITDISVRIIFSIRTTSSWTTTAIKSSRWLRMSHSLSPDGT